MGPERKYKNRGFAGMNPAKRKAAQSKGGIRAHELGTGHEWTREEAIANGRKGGIISRGGRGKLKPEGDDA
jgi:hypothetical protein